MSCVYFSTTLRCCDAGAGVRGLLIQGPFLFDPVALSCPVQEVGVLCLCWNQGGSSRVGARTREGAVAGGSQDAGQARGEATPPDSERELLGWSRLCASAPPSITPETQLRLPTPGGLPARVPTHHTAQDSCTFSQRPCIPLDWALLVSAGPQHRVLLRICPRWVGARLWASSQVAHCEP